MTEIRHLQEIALADGTRMRVVKTDAFIELEVVEPPKTPQGGYTYTVRLTHEERQALLDMLTVTPPPDPLTVALELAKQAIPTLAQPTWEDVFVFKGGAWRCRAHARTPKSCLTCRSKSGDGTHVNPTDKDTYCNRHSKRLVSCETCKSQYSDSETPVG